jgi:hypothetical protein
VAGNDPVGDLEDRSARGPKLFRVLRNLVRYVRLGVEGQLEGEAAGRPSA